MSQDYVDDLYSPSTIGDTTLSNMEKNFAALKSAFSGTSAPSNPVAGMWWLDTANHILKQRNEANNAWLSVWDMANNKPFVSNLVSEDFGAALRDPAAGTAGLRTLGTGAQQALPGNTDLTPPDGSVTLAKLAPYSAGDVLLLSADTERTTDSTSYVKVKEFLLQRAGTYRVRWRMWQNVDGSQYVYGRVYRNGSPVVPEHYSNSLSPVQYADDISGCNVGDYIQIYYRITHSNHSAYIDNARIYVDRAESPSVTLD